jgi:cytoskeletal protein CcmA (bactofilin family)
MISMSGKNKQSKSNKVHTLIGDETEIRGDVIFDGGLFVDGTVIGNVEAKAGTASILNLSDKGSVEGQVRVPHIILNGTVIGDVYIGSSGYPKNDSCRRTLLNCFIIG